MGDRSPRSTSGFPSPALRPGLTVQRTDGGPGRSRGLRAAGGRKGRRAEVRIGGGRAGPGLTFVLCHKPLERRPCHRLGKSGAVGPKDSYPPARGRGCFRVAAGAQKPIRAATRACAVVRPGPAPEGEG